MLYLHRMPVPASCPDGSHSAIHMSRYILLPVASIDPKSPSLQHASCKAGKRSSARTVDTAVAPASSGSRSFCCTMGWAHRILVISQLALTPKALVVQPILRWAGLPATWSVRCVAEAVPPRRRRPTMDTQLPSGGDIGGVDDPSSAPRIPDAVGTAALQGRLDSIKRRESYRPANNASRKAAAPTAGATGRQTSAVHHGALCSVWVLMFDSGPRSGDQRGLYCLWSNGLNSVVAFEGRDGALRYALELKAQGLGLPGPTRVTVNDLQQFCREHSFGLEVVPADVVPVAPDKNKEDLEFDPKAPHQGGRRGGGGNRLSPTVSEEASVFTPEDVRKFRAKFERLYAQE